MRMRFRSHLETNRFTRRPLEFYRLYATIRLGHFWCIFDCFQYVPSIASMTIHFYQNWFHIHNRTRHAPSHANSVLLVARIVRWVNRSIMFMRMLSVSVLTYRKQPKTKSKFVRGTIVRKVVPYNDVRECGRFRAKIKLWAIFVWTTMRMKYNN